MELAGKTVLITGAAQGLGAAMAEHLAMHGARLALLDLDRDKLDAAAKRLAAVCPQIRTYPCNVARESDVVETYASVVSDFGALDVAIANAGILRDGLLIKTKDGTVSDRLSLDDWQAVIDVNLTGVFLCGREAAAKMATLGTPGVIVNVSSISRRGNFGQTNYSAAKAGVAAMTVVWAKELARHGIRVNAIAPGFVETEILSRMPPEALDKARAAIPAGRLGTPAEIAASVRFIVENDYVNGRVLEIDGGLRL